MSKAHDPLDWPHCRRPGSAGLNSFGFRVLQNTLSLVPAGTAQRFRGWRVVAGCFVVLVVTAGVGFYNLTVYLQAFVQARSFSVSSVSAATGAFFLAAGISGVLVARFIERRDVRIVLVAGALLGTVTLAASSLVQSVPQLYAFYVVLGISYTSAGLVPCTTVLARWFVKKRTIALASAFTGLSLGGIVLTPLCVWLIDHLGIGGAGPWLGGLYFIGITVPALTLIRSRPEELGQVPDGEVAPLDGEAPPEEVSVPFHTAVRSRFFVWLSLGYVLVMTAQVGGISHLFRLVAGRQDAATAALAVAVLAGSSIVGRLLAGWLLPRMRMRPATIAIVAVQSPALAVLSHVEGHWALLVFAAMFGSTIGNIGMLQPLLVAEAFGVKAYARIYARAQLLTTLGAATGPTLFGWLYDQSGGYELSYGLAAALSFACCLCITLAGPTLRTRSRVAAEPGAEGPY
jgi:sugar phosphate permease